MPDITLCNNEECLQKKSCYRFTATPNPYYQSYATFKFKVVEDTGNPFWGKGRCDYYIDTKNLD